LSGLIRSEAMLVLAGIRHETVPTYATHHAARRPTMLRPPILRQSPIVSNKHAILRRPHAKLHDRQTAWNAATAVPVRPSCLNHHPSETGF